MADTEVEKILKTAVEESSPDT